MLIVRRQQLRAVAAARFEELADQLVAELAGSFPEYDNFAAHQRAEIEAGLTVAFRYFSRLDEVRRYMGIVLQRLGGWRHGPHPAAAVELLDNRALPDRRRLDNFERWAMRQQRGCRGR